MFSMEMFSFKGSPNRGDLGTKQKPTASIALMWICGAPTGDQTKNLSLYFNKCIHQTPNRPPHGAATRIRVYIQVKLYISIYIHLFINSELYI